MKGVENMKTLTDKEARILGLLIKCKGDWKKIAAQFSMSEDDFKALSRKAMAKSYRIGKEKTTLAVNAALAMYEAESLKS